MEPFEHLCPKVTVIPSMQMSSPQAECAAGCQQQTIP